MLFTQIHLICLVFCPWVFLLNDKCVSFDYCVFLLVILCVIFNFQHILSQEYLYIYIWYIFIFFILYIHVKSVISILSVLAFHMSTCNLQWCTACLLTKLSAFWAAESGLLILIVTSLTRMCHSQHNAHQYVTADGGWPSHSVRLSKESLPFTQWQIERKSYISIPKGMSSSWLRFAVTCMVLIWNDRRRNKMDLTAFHKKQLLVGLLFEHSQTAPLFCTEWHA